MTLGPAIFPLRPAVVFKPQQYRRPCVLLRKTSVGPGLGHQVRVGRAAEIGGGV